MSSPSIHLLFEFTDGAGGGGNQFLKALRKYLKHAALYEDRPGAADVILVNSHHCLLEAMKLKRECPEKIVLHRLAGPISLTRKDGFRMDAIIHRFNRAFPDGSVFQSTWSKRALHNDGLKEKGFETVIMNAPDPTIFYGERGKVNRPKVRLIATSWSANPNKGFDIYKYLDGHLNFDRHEMTFVGNSPITFANIEHISARPARELADILRAHDIFIAACKDDACSNSLIEALHCGLPAVFLDSGGNREIVGNGGVTFTGSNDVLRAVDEVRDNFESYQRSISVADIVSVGTSYYEFGKRIYDKRREGRWEPETVAFPDYLSLLFRIHWMRWLSRIRSKLRQIRRSSQKWPGALLEPGRGASDPVNRS